MATIDLRLEMSIYGSVLTDETILENKHTVGLWAYNGSGKYYFKDLPNYSVEGDTLEVSFKIKGKNGANAKLKIKIKGQPDEEILCVISNGSDRKIKSIDIQ